MLTDEQIQKVKEALHHTHLLTKYMYYGSLGIAFIIIGLIDFVIFKYTTNLVFKLLALGLILYGLGFIVYVVKHIKSTNEKLAIILYRLETHTYLYKKINTYSVIQKDKSKSIYHLVITINGATFEQEISSDFYANVKDEKGDLHVIWVNEDKSATKSRMFTPDRKIIVPVFISFDL